MMIQIVLAFLLSVVSCDLIGYNRLGNNIYSHTSHRDNQKLPYGAQLAQFVLEQYDGDMDLLRKAVRRTHARKRPNKFNRRMRYTRRMLNH